MLVVITVVMVVMVIMVAAVAAVAAVVTNKRPKIQTKAKKQNTFEIFKVMDGSGGPVGQWK